MARKHDEIAEELNNAGRFPWHGVATCSDGSAVLIFPFLRATWELQKHNEHFERAIKLKWRDVFTVAHFQDRWFRVLEVTNKLTELEATILKDARDHEFSAAHRELPLWLDLFHFYIPMLLDAAVVALGVILSDAPSSFPRQFKGLFKEGLQLEGMNLRCSIDEFHKLVTVNREWHDQIRPANGKSIRDSIVHRLSKWQIGTRTECDEPATMVVNAQLEGRESDISPDDGLVNASQFLVGFCSFLSSLPKEVWVSHAFDRRDLITADDPVHLGGRFLPLLPEVIQLRQRG